MPKHGGNSLAPYSGRNSKIHNFLDIIYEILNNSKTTFELLQN